MQAHSLETLNAAPRLKLRVTSAAESTLRSGHPWLFADSIREQNREGTTGELAVVYDRNNRFLAVGLFDADSPIRLRVLHAGVPQTIDRSWMQTRLRQALNRRHGLFDRQTTGFRWISGESDGWPGLVLDKYERTLVLKLYTAAWLPHLRLLTELVGEQLQPDHLVLRLSRNVQEVAANAFPEKDGQLLRGSGILHAIGFLENGIRFEADVVRGQKTGFFLDQRENRRNVELFAPGRKVLNAFSFSGAFSVYAARGGASLVSDLDISAYALKAADRNFELNRSLPQVAACSHEKIQADAFEWLDSSARRFDLVILDPPSLAKRASEKTGAIRAYGRLTQLALRHLAPGGILVSCSCSAHVAVEEFFSEVRKVARQAGGCAELKTTTQPPDHPASFREAHYLKAIYLERLH